MSKTRIAMVTAAAAAILATAACGSSQSPSTDRDSAAAPASVPPPAATPTPQATPPSATATDRPTAPGTTATGKPSASATGGQKNAKPGTDTQRDASGKPGTESATESGTPSGKPTPPTQSPTAPTTSAKPSTTAPPKPKPSATEEAKAKYDPRCMTGRAMCIDKTTRQLTWLIDGVPQYSFEVRFGSQELPTREGAFKVDFKSKDHVSTLYHTPMPYAMFFSGGQAVHYSPDFAANGYKGASHGCVNVRNKPLVEKLFAESQVGDKVIVYRS
ncbi:L,D-transpeptidase [Yinghuangia soli]|uniref:L,D-transpeptidase family protein n=1 Tax=Yinghuangia soli TaxID=2908204 RepID=A0AA41U216_9ACTN|nr:L,D-transpeptidase [Yinghuangia soli]MCF2530205.1 L,D-transpeptidase family protein [Yinghuangia soli]